MFWFIIVLLIFIAISEWTCNLTQIFSDGLKTNIFTLLAVISSLVGAFYFWASSKSYKDYKIKDKLMKLFNDNLPFKSGSNLPAKQEIDLSQIDLKGLVGEMQRVLTSPTPLIFKGWGNRRLEMDVERVGLMNEYIQNVIATGQSFVRLKVDALISYEKIQLMARTELNELRRGAAISEFNLRLLKDQFQNQITAVRTDTEKMNLSINRIKQELKIQNEQHSMDIKERESIIKEREHTAKLNELVLRMQADKQEAEKFIYMMIAKDSSMLKNKLAKFYDKVIKSLNMDDLTPSQVLIILSIFGNGKVDNVDDFETKKKLVDQEIERMKQENEYKKHEAKEKYYDSEFKNYKYQKEKMSFGG